VRQLLHAPQKLRPVAVRAPETDCFGIHLFRQSLENGRVQQTVDWQVVCFNYASQHIIINVLSTSVTHYEQCVRIRVAWYRVACPICIGPIPYCILNRCPSTTGMSYCIYFKSAFCSHNIEFARSCQNAFSSPLSIQGTTKKLACDNFFAVFSAIAWKFKAKFCPHILSSCGQRYSQYLE